MLRYANHYERDSTILKTAMEILSRLQYDQVHGTHWKKGIKTLKREIEVAEAWYRKIHSKEYMNWRAYAEDRPRMLLVEKLGVLCNLRWTEVKALVTGYLNIPHQYETIDEKHFYDHWNEAKDRIAADLWGMANSILPSTLVYARKEIEETISKVQGLYFKRFDIGRSIEITNLYQKYLEKDFGSYRERWTGGSHEKVDAIRSCGLRWEWDEMAATDFEMHKCALNSEARTDEFEEGGGVDEAAYVVGGQNLSCFSA
jgi:hypothetical protein